MKNNKTAIAQSPNDLMNDLQALVAEAQKLMDESMTDHANEGITTSRSRYDAVQERMTELYNTARDKITAGTKSTDIAIRENPYQALAIAAGAGLLAGMLLGRRSS